MTSRSRTRRRDFLASTAGLASSLSTQRLALASTEEPLRDFKTSSHGMKSFRLAAVSMMSFPASPKRNLNRLELWVERAKNAGAQMVSFPELSVTGYVTTPEIWEAAEPIPGPSTERLEEFSARSGLTICAGIAEKDRAFVYDSYVFVGPHGYIGKSRKIHIPVPEVGYWRGGGVPPVIDLGVAQAGVNICFDNWLPESSRLVALQGAEVLFAPFVWSVGQWDNPPDYRSRNQTWKEYAGRTFPARAIDNGVFLVAMNATGPVQNGRRTYYGNSIILVYSPHGLLIAESPDDAAEETMVVAHLDRKLLAERRSQRHFHARFRRPELYDLLAQGDIGPQDPR